MTLKDFIKALQRALNAQGENLEVDGDAGTKTQKALSKYEFDVVLKKTETAIEPQQPAPTDRKTPPWYLFALQFKGKKETDRDLSNYLVPKWKLFGMDLGTIATSWAAWCGLAMAVALSGVGVDYAKNGALAKNWKDYGVEIKWKTDGIPQGAIVRINHTGNCAASSSNHVAQANGDCSVNDLLKPRASIDLYGGNQGNSWKVSTFPVAHVCDVRWPKDVKDFPKPAPITKSKNCSSSGSGDSTQ